MRKHSGKYAFEPLAGEGTSERGEARGGRERKLVILIPEGFVNGLGDDDISVTLRRMGVDSELSITNVNTEALSLWTRISYPSRT